MGSLRQPFFWAFLLVLACGMLLLGGKPTAASAPTLQLVAPTVQLVAPTGPQSTLDSLAVEVRINQAANLGAWEFDLSYDPALLTITGLTVNEFFARSAECDPAAARCALLLGPLDENGVFSAGAVSFGQGAGSSGDGVIATLHIQPKGLPGAAKLHIASALLTDTAANPITPATEDATLEFTPPSFSATNLVFLPVVSR